jgi:hypothetical protein
VIHEDSNREMSSCIKNNSISFENKGKISPPFYLNLPDKPPGLRLTCPFSLSVRG